MGGPYRTITAVHTIIHIASPQLIRMDPYMDPDMDPFMYPIWTPVWILFQSYMDPSMDSIMDLTWIPCDSYHMIHIIYLYIM